MFNNIIWGWEVNFPERGFENCTSGLVKDHTSRLFIIIDVHGI